MKCIMATILILSASIFALGQQIGIPRDASIFVEPNEGFEVYVSAAFAEKKVPLVLVADKTKADFVMNTTIERGDKPGWSQTIFLGKTKANEDASVTVVNQSNSAVVFAYSVHKYNARNGRQSTAEAVAKHLKNAIEDAEKRAKKGLAK